MSHPNCVLELAVFTVKPAARERMPALRQQLRAVLADFPGLLDYRAYAPLDGDDQFVDIAYWRDLASAQAAAEAFASGDARFAPYAAAIAELQGMRHLAPA